MEPKPVGVERDRQIAAMRGEVYCMYRSDTPIEFKGKAPCCIQHSIAWPDCHHCRMHAYKPRSTDIACAMELAEEIKAAACKPAKSPFAAYLLVRAFESWANNMKVELANSISGAYVKWEGK